MPIIKHDYPILEYDTEAIAIIEPTRKNYSSLPKICIMIFFKEVLSRYVEENSLKQISAYPSEMKSFPIYKMIYKGVELCIVQAVVGSASIASMTDFLIGYGVETIIACGGCGVLHDIPEGDVIIPIITLRDEGASYNYLPPSRTITLDAIPIDAIKKTLLKHNIPYIECMTWTTDAFYRETKDMVAYRKNEGCKVVEMECATIAAIARFRDVAFGQLLYSGDILTDCDNYNDRKWNENSTAREKLFYLALETILLLDD